MRCYGAKKRPGIKSSVFAISIGFLKFIFFREKTRKKRKSVCYDNTIELGFVILLIIFSKIVAENAPRSWVRFLVCR